MKNLTYNSKVKDSTRTSKSVETVEEKTMDTKNSIYFVGGEKGGVGKSFFSRCMLDYFIHRGWSDSFTLIEADPTITDVSSIYKENFDNTIFSDNKFTHDDPNLILKMAQEKTMVVNLPSNVCIQFDAWVERSMLLSDEIRPYFDQVVYFFVTDGCFSSIDRFIKQIEHYGNKRLPHCLVLNPGRLSCGNNFSYINDEYPALLDVLKKHKIPVIQIPELSARLQFKCDRDAVSYRELAQKTHYSEKGPIIQFLKELDLVFDSMFSNSIVKPTGLPKIIKKQMKNYKIGKSPLPTKAQLFAS